MTNSERVVTFCPAFRDPPGEARADWEVFAEVGRRLGFEQQFDHKDSADVYNRYFAATYSAIYDGTLQEIIQRRNHTESHNH